MQLLTNANFDFVNKRYLFFGISIALIIISILSIIIRGGLNLGIDFTGGVMIEVKFSEPVDLATIRKTLAKANLPPFDLQHFPKRNSVIIRIKGKEEIIEETSGKIRNTFETSTEIKNFTIERTEFVGPSIGKHLTERAMYAILLSLLGIIIYVGIRFKSTVWGVSGVIALAHDVFITIGLFSVLNREINLTVIASLLTLAGYSINDTIVIFDRIRENLSLLRKEPLEKIINTSINQTLSRTIITSLTTELVVISLFFFGGEVIHDFSLAFLFGCFIGTYSSIFIASPIVLEWINYRTKKISKR